MKKKPEKVKGADDECEAPVSTVNGAYAVLN